MEKMLQLFLIWENGRKHEEKILNDISAKYEILQIFDIKWPQTEFANNLSRFYGKRLPSGGKKEKECGTGEFTLVLCYDNNPNMVNDERHSGMQSNANGSIDINNNIINFDNDMGYIEKDWGNSFPKSYIWCQGNNFKSSNASFMLSVADVPFKMFKFRGVICVLMVGDKEYKFTTYNNARLVEFEVNDNSLNVTLKKGDMFINIYAKDENAQKLVAPVKGKMEKDIFESVTSTINVTLKQGDNIIFSDTSINCGVEIVK